MNYVITKSGVKVYKYWQDNIIIDADNPLVTKQSAKSYSTGLAKGLSRLGSSNSEDALTWNIFRTLQDIPASLWLHSILQPIVATEELQMHFWRSYAPPPSYLKAEGYSEVDLALETPSELIFIEAKLYSKVSQPKTKRNQVIRNIDVGSWYAQQANKAFYFCLLTPTKYRTDWIMQYQDADTLRDNLVHRLDTIDYEMLASHIYHIHWETIVELLHDDTFQIQACDNFSNLLGWLDRKFDP